MMKFFILGLVIASNIFYMVTIYYKDQTIQQYKDQVQRYKESKERCQMSKNSLEAIYLREHGWPKVYFKE